MSKRACIIQTILFCIFIIFFFVFNIISGSKEFSERENRVLAKAPEFSFERLFSGKFTEDFEEYVKDQFAFRDAWVTLKARSELAVGKNENRGVYFCEDATLIERLDAPDYSLLDKNISALNALTENFGSPVYFALIPGSAEIWREKLPSNAPSYSQVDIISYAYENTKAISVDLFSSLKAHSDEYIFYRTDHHWTTLGAYYGYVALADKLVNTYDNMESFDRETLSDEFYGALYSSSGFSWVSADSIEIFADADKAVEIINYKSGDPSNGLVYDLSFLDKKDKYSLFMGGNTPLLQINTGTDGAPSLLILRDSYMDSLTPFLLAHFSKIHIIDLRYFKNSLKQYITENSFDSILVCYSVKNFCTDNTIFLMNS